MMRMGRGRTVTGRALLTAVLLTAALWGCEGTHLFAPVTIGPQITELNTPAAVQSGDSIMVAVRALGLVRVDSIITTIRVGTFVQTQVARQAGILSDFSAAFDFSIPVAVSDTLGIIEAFAVDAQANIGPTATVAVRMIDTAAPTVSISLENPQLGAGTEIRVGIMAQDNIGLSQIGFQILGQEGDLIVEVLVDQVGEAVERVLTYRVPEDLVLGEVVVVGLAVDHGGNVETSLPVSATLTDVDIPEIEILTPVPGAQAPAQDPLLIAVRIRDNDAVDSVRIDGVAHRGDRALGTDIVVARFVSRVVKFDPPVSDTILQRSLVPAADSTSESAFIRVAAYDREGNVSLDSVEVALLADELPPVVQINTPSPGGSQAIGGSILVETFIEKLPALFRTGIQTLRLEGVAFRGDPELGTDQVVPRFLTRTVTFDPPVFDGQVVSRFLPATADVTQEPVFIIATAIDEWGNQAADTVSVQLVPDLVAPSLSIVFPPGGSTWPAGDSILVQAFSSEPPGPGQSGLSAMTVDGVSYRPAQVLKFVEQRVEFSPAVVVGQALLSVFIQPTGDLTLESVWIRVTAEDAAGNTRADSVMIVLSPPTPSPPPPPELGLLPIDLGPGGGGTPHRSLFVRLWAEQALRMSGGRRGRSGSGSARRRRR